MWDVTCSEKSQSGGELTQLSDKNMTKQELKPNKTHDAGRIKVSWTSEIKDQLLTFGSMNVYIRFSPKLTEIATAMDEPSE